MMMRSDPQLCRRALREIGEIAAVALLQDSQMKDQEALATIAAIAQWVREEDPASSAGCRASISRLNALTASVEFDALTDKEAVVLFDRVLDALRT